MMAVATHHKSPRDLGQMGWLRRFLRLRLQGSRKRSVLAAITAYRLELHEQEPRNTELANRIVACWTRLRRWLVTGISKLAGPAFWPPAACRS
jgi:hypothetical protein